MIEAQPNHQLMLLDACCIINLAATGQIEEILRALPYDFATTRLVISTEVISVGRAIPDGTTDREILAPTYLESLESLRVLDFLGDDELAGFVEFAASLDDGEASVCALAVSRGGWVATDDRKTLRLLEGKYPQILVVQTPELLRQWADLTGAPDDDVGKLLRSIYRKGRFYPRRDAPQFDWWERLCHK